MMSFRKYIVTLICQSSHWQLIANSYTIAMEKSSVATRVKRFTTALVPTKDANLLIGSMMLKATVSVVIAMVDTTTSKAVTSDISKTASSIADRGCIWAKSKGSRSTTDSGISWGGFVVFLNLSLVPYISTNSLSYKQEWEYVLPSCSAVLPWR